jgi:23S rRNA maturation-related 3'-5' exoribonuclease YhaM
VKAADFVGYLFLARDVTHSVHLNTRSYAKHKALQKFYEGIVDHADAFAEAYQGRHGLIGPITLMSAKKTGNVIEFLEDQLAEIEKCRYEVVDKSDSSLQQLIDNIVELYLSTLYKLKFLA